jgi:hypothetical protein
VAKYRACLIQKVSVDFGLNPSAMKTFTLLALLALIATHSFAQLDDEKLVYLKKAEKFRKMKNVGAALTFGGGALLIVGTYILIDHTTNDAFSQNNTRDSGAGIAAYLAGNAFAGAGIPLWIIGKNNYRKYNNKVNNHSTGIRLRPQANGLTLSYSF